MAIYYMKSGNSKTSDPHRPLAKYWILEYTIHGKIWKNDTRTINLIYQVQCGITNLN